MPQLSFPPSPRCQRKMATVWIRKAVWKLAKWIWKIRRSHDRANPAASRVNIMKTGLPGASVIRGPLWRCPLVKSRTFVSCSLPVLLPVALYHQLYEVGDLGGRLQKMDSIYILLSLSYQPLKAITSTGHTTTSTCLSCSLTLMDRVQYLAQGLD